jgi:hypothetical protein
MQNWSMRCGGGGGIVVLKVFTIVHIRRMSSLVFGSQDGTEGFTDVQYLPEDDQERSKHVGVFSKLCVKVKVQFTLEQATKA